MSDIRQLAAWYEKQMARLIQTEGLHVGLLGVVQGPLTLTYKVRLLQPTRQALIRLLGLGAPLAAAVQSQAVRISQAPEAIYIEIPLPAEARRTPSAPELLRHSNGLAVCVGYNQLRKPVDVDLKQHGALFWIGPSRRGKTQSMKSTLFALAVRNPKSLVYAILSQKTADWQSFKQATGCLGIVFNASEALQVLEWAVGLLHKRAVTGKHKPAIVIVADDLLNLLAQEPSLAKPLGELASMGAGLGVHLLAGTQEGGSKRGTGGSGVENNTTAKIIYRSSSAAGAARATGQSAEGVQQLSGAKGDAVLLLDGQPIRIATGFADDRDILQMQQGKRYHQPWYADGTHTQNGQNRTGTANGSVPPPTSGRTTVPDRTTIPRSVIMPNEDGVQPRTGTALPDQEPDAAAQTYLRSLYARHGSKNKVLEIAYGGVVNENRQDTQNPALVTRGTRRNGGCSRIKSRIR